MTKIFGGFRFLNVLEPQKWLKTSQEDQIQPNFSN